MKNKFILGCNYWASHAGTEMWVNWDEEEIEKDFKVLSENGVAYLRVFPNWRDFQPVIPLYGGNGYFCEYRLEGDRTADNPYYLDEIMLKRFQILCDIANKYHLKLIVGLITGFMSGRLFIPSALYNKNLYSDPVALMLQQKFARGFVERFIHHEAIDAWDLGNECNCLSIANKREEAYAWSAMISNAIRAVDNKRPIVSGMHSLALESIWSIEDQAETTDILTTHPYPYWVPHCSKDKISSIRTVLHATAETEMYSSIGKKPCLVEELGTMGPMICDEKTAADFMRVNLYSNWSNGAAGVMWWCAHDQSQLITPPYNWLMCERELGMLDLKRNPKPVLLEMKRFAELLTRFDFELPKRKDDGVVLLSKGQDNWGIAYMTYILGKQAGINLTFADAKNTIPETDIYLLPSIGGHIVMEKIQYDCLKEKIWNGATIYISMDDGFLTEFKEFTGVTVVDSENKEVTGTFLLEDKEMFFSRNRTLIIHAEENNILLKDSNEQPILVEQTYGKGKVYYLNFPLEKMLLTQSEAFSKHYHLIYKKIFSNLLKSKLVTVQNSFIGVTEHYDTTGAYIILINYSSSNQPIECEIKSEYYISDIIYGSINEILAYECSIVRLCKNQ